MANRVDYDLIAQSYAINRSASARIVAHVAAQAAHLDHGRLLEIGCGTGDHLSALTQASGGEGHGFDDSLGMLKQAKFRYPSLKLTRGNADERFPYQDCPFVFAFSVNVIHYIKSLGNYFAEAHRILRDGGIVLTVTDSEEDIRNRTMARYFPGTIDVDLGRYPSIEMILRSMQGAGFRDVKVTHTSHTYQIDEKELDRYRNQASSTLRLISRDCFDAGIAAMTASVRSGKCEGLEVYTYVWGKR